MLTRRFVAISGTLITALAVLTPIRAATIYTTSLDGGNEVPPTASAATGTATLTLNGNMLTVSETFSGLSGPATGAHIHCCGALGINEPIAIPFTTFPNAASGSFTMTFDLTLASTYLPSFVAANSGTAGGAETALVAALNDGRAYVNIHTVLYALGEIRGQLAVQATPEPATVMLFLLGLAPVIALRRRR